jgi:hypothetical protein
MFRALFTRRSEVKTINILMFVAQPYGMTLNHFGVDDSLAHEGIAADSVPTQSFGPQFAS